mmetsp:Transcript_25900/g.40409  ORF Transcript_25900/g.40409 Transcript_25900/m.40409 type:complete len:435 (+) Transcript_25900:79-1383(+)
MTSEVVSQERIDPKVVAALVNRFIADSASFLQDFAQQCEVKLLTLNQRLQRLERLIELFERKVECLEPADGPIVRSAPVKSTQEVNPTTERKQSADSVQETAQEEVAEDVPDVAQAETAPIDEKYMKYVRMNKCGIPALAIRQRLNLDRNDDPTLDSSVLDRILGEDTTLPPIKPSKPTPKPSPPTVQPSETAAVETAAPVEAAADDVDAVPGDTAPEESPSQSGSSGPVDMMAEIQRKQRERAARMESGAPNTAVAKAPDSGPKNPTPVPSKPASILQKRRTIVADSDDVPTPNTLSTPPAKDAASAPPLFKSPSKAAPVLQSSEPETSASLSQAPIVPKVSDAPQNSVASQPPSLFKAPSVPPVPNATLDGPIAMPKPAAPDGPIAMPKLPDSAPKKAPPVPSKAPPVPSKASILQKRRVIVEDSDSEHSDF